MNDLYICYDGVDGDITYHNTEGQALEKLKYYIDSGLDNGEWMDGVSNSFVAKIMHGIKKRKIEPPEWYKREVVNEFIGMDIIKIDEVTS